MKKIFLFLLIFGSLSATTQMHLSLPLDRSVYQRNASGQAIIPITGQVRQHPNPALFPADWSSFQVKYRFIPMDKNGTLPASTSWPGWTMLAATPPYGGNFYLSVTKGTGWYELQVGAFAPSDPATAYWMSYAKVGVGEVVFLAGQSNAQGGEAVTNDAVSTTYYDCVNAINDDQFCKATFKFPAIQGVANGRYVTPNSNRSSWGLHLLGKLIVDGTTTAVTPVMFFNAGSTGTSITNWLDTAVNPSITTTVSMMGVDCCNTTTWTGSDGTAGQPYKGLRTTLNYFGGMFGARGVIWHQGEADNKELTTQSNYSSKLNSLITYSQSHFNEHLKWGISRVSYWNGTTRVAITNAQYDVKVGMHASKTSTGAWTSDLITSRSDGTHFTAAGLVALQNQYYTSYSSGNGYTALNALTPIPANISSSLGISKSGTTVTLSAPAASSYCWVVNNGNINSCYATTSSITVSNTVPYSSPTSYRCYLKDALGNVRLTPAAYVPMWPIGGAGGTSGWRLAAVDSVSELNEANEVPEEGPNQMYVSPNPVTNKASSTFYLQESKNVRLDFLDPQGRVLSTIAEGVHTPGKHTYNLPVNNLPDGIYLTVLKIDDMFITKKVIVNK